MKGYVGSNKLWGHIRRKRLGIKALWDGIMSFPLVGTFLSKVDRSQCFQPICVKQFLMNIVALSPIDVRPQ